ncbi:MAG: acylphosphatase [Thermoanaerobaculia bacterium]
MKRMSYRVTGKVQGVGFRAFAVRLARECGVVGWVRNDPDGTLRAEAVGSDAALTSFGAALRMGPSGAQVETLDAGVVDDVVDTNRTDFSVED